LDATFPFLAKAPTCRTIRRMTIEEAAKTYLVYAEVERLYARETVIKLKECFRSWLLPCLAERTVSGLSRLEVLELRRRMTERRLGPARQYSVLMTLKLFLKFCRTFMGVSCIDPAEIRLPRRTAHRVEFLTDEEVRLLVRAIPTHTLIGLRARALVEVLLSTGMRISEALSLNRNTVDPATREADIVGKGGKVRTIFFSPQCLSWIGRYLSRRKDAHVAVFVTTGAVPRRLTRNDMSKLFAKLKRYSGIAKKLTPHILRHTFCTGLLHRGADITYIKELAGHQDIETTARYYLGMDKNALRAVLGRCGSYGWGHDSPSNDLPVGPQSQAGDSPV
jgi:site-specific recombinase XerD